MMRKNIYDILSSRKFDIDREYYRIYQMFYEIKYTFEGISITLESYIREYFDMFNKDLVGRCISLEDFNNTYDFHFKERKNNIDLDYLILFSEYVINFVHYILLYGVFDDYSLEDIENHITDCMEDIGYKRIDKDDFIIFVENNPVAISVAETVKEDLSYSVIEYNHYRLKGNLLAKKNILKNMADDIENKREKLKNIDKKLTNELFCLLNKFVRHDDSDNEYISSLRKEELEEIYDSIYQMWLLAKMRLEQKEHTQQIKEWIDNAMGKGEVEKL